MEGRREGKENRKKAKTQNPGILKTKRQTAGPSKPRNSSFFPDKLKSLADEEKCFVSDIY